MGRKKRRWAKARARQQEISIGKLVATAEWNEETGEVEVDEQKK